MTQIIHQPHDHFFRAAMEDKRVAREFFNAHISSEILKKIDLNTLVLHKETFLDSALKGKATDMLYSAEMMKEEGDIYFYLLSEHQSTVDPLMAFRFLVIKVRIMERHLKQFPEKPFPIIYPILLYSGEPPWTATRDLFDLFGKNSSLAQELFYAPYNIIDVCRIPDEELRERALSGIMEFALKYHTMQHEASFYDMLFSWIAEVERKFAPIVISKETLVYLLRNMENIQAKEYTIFREKAEHYLSGRLQGEIMTLAQQFEQAGFQQGELSLLMRQLQRKFRVVPESYRQKLTAANSEELLTWGERVLDAKTLEDVFRSQ